MMLASCAATLVGLTPASRATSASQACHSGNAYPGCSPACLNSPTLCSESEWSVSSFRMRPRWKKTSPLKAPCTNQMPAPSPTPARATTPRAKRAAPGGGTPSSSRPVSDQANATTPAPSTNASVTFSEAPRAAVKASPAPTSVTDATSVAAALLCPRHRATSIPGSRTTSVAAASRTHRPNPVCGRSREKPSSATTAAGAIRRQTAAGSAGIAAGLRSSTAGCASQFSAPAPLQARAGHAGLRGPRGRLRAARPRP